MRVVVCRQWTSTTTTIHLMMMLQTKKPSTIDNLSLLQSNPTQTLPQNSPRGTINSPLLQYHNLELLQYLFATKIGVSQSVAKTLQNGAEQEDPWNQSIASFKILNREKSRMRRKYWPPYPVQTLSWLGDPVTTFHSVLSFSPAKTIFYRPETQMPRSAHICPKHQGIINLNSKSSQHS